MLDYAFLGLLILAALGFGAAPLILVALIAPHKPSTEKGAAYECGVRTRGESWVRFRIQYYVYALMFVVFDVESVFLFPWAVSYGGLGLFALIEMGVFLIMLAVGLGYAWGSGHLRWE